MVYPDTFLGYACSDAEHWNDLKLIEFKPKEFEEHDVDIKIDYCGICGSDIHTLRSGWGPTDYPVVVGHEIAGKVVRVGSKVKDIKVGDIVGVGACSCSCFNCDECNHNNEQYCSKQVLTYNSKYPSGVKSFGGYANYSRVHERFVFPIPEGLKEEIAAPMMCGGLTLFSPLLRNNVKKGTKVGIVGIGGLGHFGLMFANKMGAEVTAISHSDRKKDDCFKMGASHFISTGDDKNWYQKHLKSLDVLLVTSFAKDLPLDSYLELLKVGGSLVVIGVPDGATMKFCSFPLLLGNRRIVGSAIGSKKEAEEMLNLAVKDKVESWIQVLPMADCSKAVTMMHEGKARYRYVLKADLTRLVY